VKKSEVVTGVAKRFPALSRQVLTMSIRGQLPPMHRHWLALEVASDLFEDADFPMRRNPSPSLSRKVYIPFISAISIFSTTNLSPPASLPGLLKPGASVIDVGANIGHYTLLAASISGTTGKVHAVECSPETLAVLRGNVQRNRFRNVEIHPVAASNIRSTLELNVTAIGLSWFNPHSKWPVVKGTGTTVTVPALPVDDLVQGSIDVIKIDAERVDLDLLKGMQRILMENRSVSIIVEWAPPLLLEVGKDPLELPNWLRDAGFNKITVIDEIHNKLRALEEAIRMVQAGNLAKDWVGDLFARRVF
jgi:FkbM family methyltransferase